MANLTASLRGPAAVSSTLLCSACFATAAVPASWNTTKQKNLLCGGASAADTGNTTASTSPCSPKRRATDTSSQPLPGPRLPTCSARLVAEASRGRANA
eukprot:358796-Chlamydomonas_euryale.AAC.2